jgi:hypothetical protein
MAITTTDTLASVAFVSTAELLSVSCEHAFLKSAGGFVQMPCVGRLRLAAALRISLETSSADVCAEPFEAAKMMVPASPRTPTPTPT